jgi:hypothetical protein
VTDEKPTAPTPSPVSTIEVDPTDLQPGDLVVRLNDYDPAGCHCDVLVTVVRGRELPQVDQSPNTIDC